MATLSIALLPPTLPTPYTFTSPHSTYPSSTAYFSLHSNSLTLSLKTSPSLSTLLLSSLNYSTSTSTYFTSSPSTKATRTPMPPSTCTTPLHSFLKCHSKFSYTSPHPIHS